MPSWLGQSYRDLGTYFDFSIERWTFVVGHHRVAGVGAVGLGAGVFLLGAIPSKVLSVGRCGASGCVLRVDSGSRHSDGFRYLPFPSVCVPLQNTVLPTRRAANRDPTKLLCVWDSERRLQHAEQCDGVAETYDARPQRSGFARKSMFQPKLHQMQTLSNFCAWDVSREVSRG